MFHSHELHLRAESILTKFGDRLSEGVTFRRWNPVCAVGYLASESGFIPLDPKRATHTTEGQDVVARVFGLDRVEIRKIMETNDTGGPERGKRLVELLRGFCPVCKHLSLARPRSYHLADELRTP